MSAWSGCMLESWVAQFPHSLCCTARPCGVLGEADWGRHLKKRGKQIAFWQETRDETFIEWEIEVDMNPPPTVRSVIGEKVPMMGKEVKSSQFQAEGPWSWEFGHFSVHPVLPHIVIKEISAATYSLTHCRPLIYVEQSQDSIGLWECGRLHISGSIWCLAASVRERIRRPSIFPLLWWEMQTPGEEKIRTWCGLLFFQDRPIP